MPFEPSPTKAMTKMTRIPIQASLHYSAKNGIALIAIY